MNKKSKISIILYAIIIFLIVILFVFVLTFLSIFWGREIPNSLSTWSAFASVFSSIISLSNLVLVTFLTTKAHDFQRRFSSRQLEVDRIKVITDYRIKKLSELELCVNSLNDIVKIPFTNKKQWKEQLKILLRSITLFDECGTSIFDLKEYKDFEVIESKCIEIITLIEKTELSSAELGKEMQEFNKLIIILRNKLWEYTYGELKKDLGEQ